MNTVSELPPWLHEEYPFTPKVFVTPAGARMSYLDEGRRSPSAVLMLHGNPTWSFYYRNLVKALLPSRRCLVPDHVGMGLSAKPGAYDYTLASRIADVEAMVAAAGVETVDLVLHDWGGAIGFGFAARNPEKIRRIVILNTAAFAMDQIPLRIAVCKLPVLGPLLVRGLNAFAGPATWMAMHRRALTPVQKRGYLLPFDSWAHRVAVSAFVRDIPLRRSHPSWLTLKEIESRLVLFRDRPVLIIWGGKDFCFDDVFLARWREIIPNARVCRIEDAGHYVLEDASAEVVPQITAYLRSES